MSMSQSARQVRALSVFFFFFFNDTATTEIYTLSLHDALPILGDAAKLRAATGWVPRYTLDDTLRSEEHTSELQSQSNLVCRLLLEKKKNHHQFTDRLALTEHKRRTTYIGHVSSLCELE